MLRSYCERRRYAVPQYAGYLRCTPLRDEARHRRAWRAMSTRAGSVS